MKLLTLLLKLLVAGILFFTLSIVFMISTVTYLPRLHGANYYDHGCFDGVTNLMMEFRYNNKWENDFQIFEDQARKYCDSTVKQLNKDGYLFK